MVPTHDTLTESDLHLGEGKPEETHGGFGADEGPSEETPVGFETAMPEASGPEALEEAVPKHGKKKKKHKKPDRLKEKKSSAQALAVAFPVVALIDEQVRTSIPEELVARVKAAKSKKHIISSNYPYRKQMRESDYLEELSLIHI